MINENEFEVLVCLEREKRCCSQREVAKLTNLSLGTVNKAMISLTKKNFISENGNITPEGINALEPFRVKRAVFLAAGFGSRMHSITLNTPKTLVRVNGKRIIETLIDAVKKAEIPEIVIVTGYLHEQFEELLRKYDNIKLIYNKFYNEMNNISSAYVVKDLLKNAYVLESDLLLYNSNLIRKYEFHSNFLGKKVDVTDDWCFDVKNGIIIKEKQGGYDCYQMYGISYYDEKDGEKISSDITKDFNMPGGKEKYWEQVILDVCKNNYKIYLRECYNGDIIEIDSFKELKEIDKSYDI